MSVSRLVFLFTRLSGYTSACLKSLVDLYDVDITVIQKKPSYNAPFGRKYFEWIDDHYYRGDLSGSDLLDIVQCSNPDGVYMSGWVDRGYMKTARTLNGESTPVIAAMDNQWNATFRQRLGELAAPFYLHSAIDILWVPGERQRQLASKLGYTGDSCWEGLYACAWDQFAAVYQDDGPAKSSFLFIGQYIERKGVDLLLRAYHRYRSIVDEPWSLICAGKGPEKEALTEVPGVVDKGFTQPEAVPDLMKEASSFILPSRSEPWGVVIQEAAAAGLPLICSEACGATVHLLTDGYNGYLTEAADLQSLTRSMVRMSNATDDKRHKMGARSHMLSKQYTPHRWAETLVEGIEDYKY